MDAWGRGVRHGCIGSVRGRQHYSSRLPGGFHWQCHGTQIMLGCKTRQGDDNRAVGGKSEMPHEMLLRLPCDWSLCGMECQAYPGVLWYSLGTWPSAKVQEERGPYLCDHPERWNHPERWTGCKTRQGDDHRAVGGKSKMPHEILLRDSESRSTGSRFWWNPEKYFISRFLTSKIEPEPPGS